MTQYEASQLGKKGIAPDECGGIFATVRFHKAGTIQTLPNGDKLPEITSDDTIFEGIDLILNRYGMETACTTAAILQERKVAVIKPPIVLTPVNPEAEILERIQNLEDAQDIVDFNADFGTVALTVATKSLLDAKIAAITAIKFQNVVITDQTTLKAAIVAGLAGTELTDVVAKLTAKGIVVTV
jgi:hypothetical protein